MTTYPNVAILLPAYNEEAAIERTIASFRAALPGAQIYVCDNASDDQTGSIAQKAGATVIHEPRKGKGFAVRRLFEVVQADEYVLCDADLTYDAAAVPGMIDVLRLRHLDMITGVRQHEAAEAYRAGHVLGNQLFNWLFARLFRYPVADVFSGLRVMSRGFVKSFPIHSAGFEIESEISAIAAAMRFPCAEMAVRYFSRPEGSHSKLRTYRDGWRILTAFIHLFREHHPIPFFWGLGGACMALAIVLGVPLFVTYLETGLVPRFPTAILSTGLMLLGMMLSITGLILDSLARLRLENRRLVYLQVRPQHHDRAARLNASYADTANLADAGTGIPKGATAKSPNLNWRASHAS